MAKLLWRPSEERIKASNMYRFMQFINERFGRNFKGYEELYRWSVENIPDFWASMWEFAGIKASKPHYEVVDDAFRMPGAKWFSGADLNFAENLLRYCDDEVAVIFKGEIGPSRKLTFKELYQEVARVARSLKEMGVE
ncbi:MAG: acetoacetate--CoA ligase, partial [Deltaproteobacteria bacterium]|nr:acetoacetate--CoA ligase [Deltaproteobacteria bacterium]